METTVRQAVSDLQNEFNQRNSMIRRSIGILQKQAAAEKEKVDALMRDLVKAEMAGDSQSTHKIEQQISQLRSQDIQDRISGYEAALADTEWLKPRVVEIFRIAKEQQNSLMAGVQQKSNRSAEIEREFTALRDEKDALNSQIRIAHHERESIGREIAQLGQLVESRIEQGQELAFLQAFAAGRPVNTFLPKPEQPWAPQEQLRGSEVFGSKQPQPHGQVGEIRDLCIGTHTNSGLAVGEN